MWHKEGYHEDYTKSAVLPDDRDDITEYVELLSMLDSPSECKCPCVASTIGVGQVVTQ